MMKESKPFAHLSHPISSRYIVCLDAEIGLDRIVDTDVQSTTTTTTPPPLPQLPMQNVMVAIKESNGNEQQSK